MSDLSQFKTSDREEGADVDYDNGQAKDRNAEKSKAVQWTRKSAGLFQSCATTTSELPAGVYKYVNAGMGMAFEEQTVNVDELLTMPDSLCDKIMQEIQVFLTTEETFRQYNIRHARGYLFYGPPGSGKTSLVNQVVKNILNQDGVVLICNNPTNLEQGLKDLRSVEPDRFIVCMFEDIDALICNYGEREILAVLDGESQVNKVLNIATTNYPQKLDRRIVSRPRRFDRVIEIGFPSEALRRHYFEHKLKIAKGELEVWVKATKDFSFGACTDLLVSVKCLGNDFDSSVNILRDMMAPYTKKPVKKKKE